MKSNFISNFTHLTFFALLLTLNGTCSYALENQWSRERGKLVKLTQAYAEYHSRMEFAFLNPGGSFCSVQKDSLFSAILEDVKMTKLNKEEMAPTIHKASSNQHEFFKLSLEKIKKQIEGVNFDFKELTNLCLETNKQVQTFDLQKLVSSALPPNRMVPGMENILRCDAISRVHYKEDGSYVLEEQLKLPVFPSLPDSWQAYMQNEMDDHLKFLKFLVSSLNILRKSVLRQKLGRESSLVNLEGKFSSSKELNKKYKERLSAPRPSEHLSPSQMVHKSIDVPNEEKPQGLAAKEKDVLLSPEEAEQAMPEIALLKPRELMEEKAEQPIQPTNHGQEAEEAPITVIARFDNNKGSEISPRPLSEVPLPEAKVKVKKTSVKIREKSRQNVISRPAQPPIPIGPKFIESRKKIANISPIRSTEFFKFILELKRLNFTKIQENKNGLLVWFGEEEVHLFHRIHNRGFFMEAQDLRVANKALNNIGLTAARFMEDKKIRF